MHFIVLSLFPEMFPGPLGQSIAGKALANNKWQLTNVNLRDYAKDTRQTVDDRPFGGGAGMVIKPEILAAAIDDIIAKHNPDQIIYFTPKGSLLKQSTFGEALNASTILLIAGRYEGIDERILEHYQIIEYSLGDFVLSGGEIPCLTFMDGCIRLIPQVVGNADTTGDESFGSNHENLLEYPHYTRPVLWRGRKVPDVLLSGNHQQINEWRRQQARAITLKRRPELLSKPQQSGPNAQKQ